MSYDANGYWVFDPIDSPWMQAQSTPTRSWTQPAAALVQPRTPAFSLGSASTGYQPVANPSWTAPTTEDTAGPMTPADYARADYRKALVTTQKIAAKSGPPTADVLPWEAVASLLGGIAGSFDTGSRYSWGARLGNWAAGQASSSATTRYQNALNAWQYAQAKDAEREAEKAKSKGFLGSLLGTIGGIGGTIVGGPLLGGLLGDSVGTAVGGALGSMAGSAIGSGGTSLTGGSGVTGSITSAMAQDAANARYSAMLDALKNEKVADKAATAIASEDAARAAALNTGVNPAYTSQQYFRNQLGAGNGYPFYNTLIPISGL